MALSTPKAPPSGRGRRLSTGSAKPSNPREDGEGPTYHLVRTGDDEDGAAPGGSTRTATGPPGTSVAHRCRERGADCLASPAFNVAMALVIVANAVVIGIQTEFPNAALWHCVENTFLMIFTAEVIFRMLVFGIKGFWEFRGPDFTWNALDFLLVTLGILDVILSGLFVPDGHGRGEGELQVTIRTLRLLRLLRILRIVRFLKQLHVLTFGFVAAAVAIRNVGLLMFCLIYACSIFVVHAVERVDSEFFELRYGTICRAMLSLFDLMCVPDLSPYFDILTASPNLAVFFVSFVIFGSFGMVGLLNGLICESMFKQNQVKIDAERLEGEVKRQALIQKCESIFDHIGNEHEGEASLADVQQVLPAIEEVFVEEGVQFAGADLETMLNCMDTDGSGSIDKDEFCKGVLKIADGLKPMSLMEMHYVMSIVKVKMDACELLLRQIKSQQELDRRAAALHVHVASPRDDAVEATTSVMSSARRELAVQLTEDHERERPPRGGASPASEGTSPGAGVGAGRAASKEGPRQEAQEGAARRLAEGALRQLLAEGLDRLAQQVRGDVAAAQEALLRELRGLAAGTAEASEGRRQVEAKLTGLGRRLEEVVEGQVGLRAALTRSPAGAEGLHDGSAARLRSPPPAASVAGSPAVRGNADRAAPPESSTAPAALSEGAVWAAVSTSGDAAVGALPQDGSSAVRAGAHETLEAQPAPGGAVARPVALEGGAASEVVGQASSLHDGPADGLRIGGDGLRDHLGSPPSKADLSWGRLRCASPSPLLGGHWNFNGSSASSTHGGAGLRTPAAEPTATESLWGTGDTASARSPPLGAARAASSGPAFSPSGAGSRSRAGSPAGSSSKGGCGGPFPAGPPGGGAGWRGEDPGWPYNSRLGAASDAVTAAAGWRRLAATLDKEMQVGRGPPGGDGAGSPTLVVPGPRRWPSTDGAERQRAWPPREADEEQGGGWNGRRPLLSSTTWSSPSSSSRRETPQRYHASRGDPLDRHGLVADTFPRTGQGPSGGIAAASSALFGAAASAAGRPSPPGAPGRPHLAGASELHRYP